MNNANTADLNESMAYQRGATGNPFLIVLHRPGAAEMLENRPAVDGTGRNLVTLFEMIRNKLKTTNSKLGSFLFLRKVSILNVNPVPAYTGFTVNVNFQKEWSKRISNLMNQHNKKFIISFGNAAHDFLTRYKTTLPNQVVIEVCHVGTQGLNRQLQLESSKECCPLYKRLRMLSCYLSETISKQNAGTLKEFKDWVEKHKRDVIFNINRSLVKSEKTVRQCANYADYENTVLQVMQSEQRKDEDGNT